MSYSVRSVTIGDLCREGGGSVQTGPFGSQLKASTYVPVGVPTVMPADLIDFRVSEQNVARIGPEDHLRMVRHHLEPGDIVYGRRGDIGRHALVTERERGWLCGTGCLRIRFGRASVDPQFVSYYLRQPSVIESILGKAVGTTMPNLNTSILESVTLELPPLAIQRRIAEILGRLDDKIEVNRRINRTLERMAQALYKHWFVDFGPFQDGEFVESEVGLAPRGWEVGVLGDIARNDKDLVDPREIDPQTPYIGLGDMPQGSITLDTWGVAGDSISTKCKMNQGQILFGKLRPYFKKVGVAPVEGVCSTDILVVAPMQDEYHSLVLCQLIQQDFIDYTEAVSDGTRMPRVSWEMMAKYPMLIPDRAAVLGFNEIVRPWLAIITHNVIENRSLTTTRDYLLPRLLAGEVEVL